MYFMTINIKQYFILQEYRGYDSSVVLSNDERFIQPLCKLECNINTKADFFGIVPRLILFQCLDKITAKAIQKLNGIHSETYFQLKRSLLVTYCSKYNKSNCICNGTQYFKIICYIIFIVYKIFPCQASFLVTHMLFQKNIETRFLLNIFIKPTIKTETLSQLFPDPNELILKLKDLTWSHLTVLSHPSVRQYVEIILYHLLENFPEIISVLILENLHNQKVKTHAQIPLNFVLLKYNIQYFFLQIACYYISRNQNSPVSKQLFETIFPFVTSSVAYMRSLTTTVALQYIHESNYQLNFESFYLCILEKLDEQPYLKSFKYYFEQNKDIKKIVKNMQTLLEKYDFLRVNKLTFIQQIIKTQFELEGILALQIDTYGELIHENIIEELKIVCMQTIQEIKEVKFINYQIKYFFLLKKKEDNVAEKKMPSWFNYVERELKQEQQQESQNNGGTSLVFQRKLDYIMDNFSLFSGIREREVVGDIILVASLLEKIPNFGHLSRTCEIFGVRELTIPYKEILEDENFKTVSVTSEMHLPITEIKADFLMNYLLLKKQQGYKLIAVEQTSNSQNLVNYKFDQKVAIVLGNEKKGLPVEFIQMMDVCLEIPQYGVIRSLNAYISGLLCIWQYVQQMKFGF